MIIKCLKCTKEFNKTKPTQKFCSVKCRFEKLKETIDVKDVVKMYSIDLLGIPTISKKHGINQRTITKILQDNNIMLRDKTWILTNRPPFKGKKFSEEQLKNLKEKALQAYKNDPTLVDKIRQKTLQQISEGRMPKANTSIEKKVANILMDLGIKYEHQKIFGYWVFDFYLTDYNIFIECDGDYWHANPEIYDKNKLNDTQKNNIRRGKSKETYAIKRGYKLIRLWENEINNNTNLIKEKIIQCLKTK